MLFSKIVDDTYLLSISQSSVYYITLSNENLKLYASIFMKLFQANRRENAFNHVDTYNFLQNIQPYTVCNYVIL